MFSRRAPNLLLVSFIALWGIAGQPIPRDAAAAPRTIVVSSAQPIAGAAQSTTHRRVSNGVLGDPDDFTQTGGNDPKPVVPGSANGRAFFNLLMDVVRAVGVLIGAR